MVKSSEGVGGGARARARQAVRAQVSAMTLSLCVDNGYENTNVDDICRVAVISRSTFFRYFTSKDDALLGEVDSVGVVLLEALQARPDDESPWDALRHAFGSLVEVYGSEPQRTRQLVELMESSPSLSAGHLEKNARWMPLLRPEVARRLGLKPDDLSDPRASALIASALACADATVSAWLAGDIDRSLTTILAEAMGAIANYVQP